MYSTGTPEREAAEGESLQVRAYTLLVRTYICTGMRAYLDFASAIRFHLHLTFAPRVGVKAPPPGLEDKGEEITQRHLGDN